ncbi:exosome complex component RRP40 [Nematocida sp. AWRm80]|nr:exosome complex component RRP40 [Nematocida sp. AWRm80]
MYIAPGDKLAVNAIKTSIGIENGKSMVFGEVSSFDNSNYWIDYKQNRYIPSLDDIVLGVVKGKGKEAYKVNINSPSTVVLDQLDFLNATKRNRINLVPGDILLMQVIDDSLHSEIRVSCKTEIIKDLGLLKDGVLLNIGILRSRKFLLSPPELKSECKCIFSMNGFVWVYPGAPEVIREVLKVCREKKKF